MNDVTEVLTEARNLISEPEHWIQGVYARDAQGLPTDWGSPEAVCWCVTGAILKAAAAIQEQSIEHHALVMRSIKELMFGIDSNIYTFNDSHNHAEVLEMIGRAIEERKA